MLSDVLKHLDGHDALQEVTAELEQAEARIEELESELEGRKKLMLTLAGDKIDLVSELAGVKFKLAKALEALEWQADAIHNSVTVNMKDNHRILLDGIYHEGQLVDWVHKILTGFEAINRTTLAELTKERSDEKGETDE